MERTWEQWIWKEKNAPFIGRRDVLCIKSKFFALTNVCGNSFPLFLRRLVSLRIFVFHFKKKKLLFNVAREVMVQIDTWKQLKLFFFSWNWNFEILHSLTKLSSYGVLLIFAKSRKEFQSFKQNTRIKPRPASAVI